MSLPRQTACEHIAIDRIVVDNQQTTGKNCRLQLSGYRVRHDFVVVVRYGREGLVLKRCEVLFDEREHAMTGGADVFEVRHQALASLGIRSF